MLLPVLRPILTISMSLLNLSKFEYPFLQIASNYINDFTVYLLE